MSDVIGSAVIDVTVDGSGVSAGVASINRDMASFERAATTSATRAGAAMSKANREATITSSQLTREQERLISTINNYSQTLGKSRGDVLEYRAAQAGITDQVQAQIAAIRAQEAALQGSGKALNRYGVSAGQTAAALRQVPAQLSDIVVSLQGGQAPLTVLLQQGSQLKDSFGGVVPAAKALGGAVLGLINPYTIAAAAAATLGVAYYQGSKEADGYRKALILTGNVAGTSAGQIAQMAASIDVVVGTQGQAAAALTAMASTGQVAGGNLEKFATTAVRAQRTIGTSVEDTAKAFAELGQEPLKASEKLNQSMNYLTLSVYDQIKALEEQGRKTEAAAVAQKAYDAAMDTATKRLEGNLGTIERLVLGLTDKAKGMWDSILGVGRQQTPQSQLSAAEKAVDALQRTVDSRVSRGMATGDVKPQLDAAQAYLETQRESVRLSNRQATAEGEKARFSKEGIEATKANAKWSEAALSAQEKTNRALEVYRANNVKINAARAYEGRDPLSARQIAAEEAAIIKANAGPKGAAPRAFQDDAATKYLEQLKQTEASLKAQLEVESKLTEAQKDQAKFQQLIADLKEKKILTAEQKSMLADEARLTAQHATNVALADQVKLKEEAAKRDKEAADALERYRERAEGINDSIARNSDTRKDSYSSRLSSMGLGDRARSQASEQIALQREFDGYFAQNSRKLSKGVLNSKEYADEVVRIQSSLDDAKKALDNFFQGEEQARGNWMTGATRALDNYIDSIKDVAGTTERAFNTAFSSIEDGFTELITTGKISAGKIGEQFFAEITRSIVKQQITGPLAEYLQSGLKEGSGLGGLLSGFMGTGKGESWLGGLLGTGGSKAATGPALGGVSASSGTASTALYGLAEAANAAKYSLGGSSGTGGSGSNALGSLFSLGAGLFGGFDNGTATAMANASGGGLDDLFRFTNNFSGRAGGGYVAPGSVHEVVENGPELLTFGNKTLLMNGNQSGQVTPMKSGGRPVQVNNTFVLHQPASRETQAQISRRTGQSVDTAMRRNG